MRMFRLVLPVVLCAILTTSLPAMPSNAMDVEQLKSANPAFILFALQELENEGLLPHDVSLLIVQEYHYLQILLDSEEYQDVLGRLKEEKTDPYSLTCY